MTERGLGEKRYELFVMALAVAVVVQRLWQWRDGWPDLNPVAIVALLLVPLAVRTQVPISRDDSLLTLGASAAALFASDVDRASTILPIWAVIVTVSYVFIHRDETFGLFRAAIQVLGGEALLLVAPHVDLGFRPYDRTFVALLAYFAAITVLEMARRQTNTGPGLILNLQLTWVVLVGLAIYYVAVLVAIVRRWQAGQSVPLTPTLVVGVIGLVGLCLAMLRHNRALGRALGAVVDAAVAMPWDRADVVKNLKQYSHQGLRAQHVYISTLAATGFSIGAPLEGGGHLVAARERGDLPFSEVDRRLVRALASMAGASRRRADADELLVQRATTDGLTGLLNYTRFRDALDEVSRTRDAGETIGLTFLDLNEFKAVNDRFGHLFGDAVLCVVADRLRAALGEDALATRFGGDEFAFVSRRVRDLSHLGSTVAAIIDRVTAPMAVGETVVTLTAGTGSAISMDADDDIDELVRRADRVMITEKRELHAGEEESQLFIGDAVRTLISDGDIDVHLQPVRDLATSRIVGFEALVRATAPRLGAIPPLVLVRLASRLNMLDDLTSVVVRKSIETVDEVMELLGYPVWLSINVEIDQLALWSSMLDDLVQRSTASQATVYLEISERTIGRWSEANDEIAARLRRGGVSLAIDDFGSGEATLGSIHRAPSSIVKIDRSLVVGLQDPRKQLLLRRVLEMLHEQHFSTVVEGVETPEEADVLRDVGARYVQGMLFGPPMSRVDLLERLAPLRKGRHAAPAQAPTSPTTPTTTGRTTP